MKRTSAYLLKAGTTDAKAIAHIKNPKQRQQVLKWVQQQQKAERDRQNHCGKLRLNPCLICAEGQLFLCATSQEPAFEYHCPV